MIIGAVTREGRRRTTLARDAISPPCPTLRPYRTLWGTMFRGGTPDSQPDRRRACSASRPAASVWAGSGRYVARREKHGHSARRSFHALKSKFPKGRCLTCTGTEGDFCPMTVTRRIWLTIPCRCLCDSPRLTRPAKVEASANDRVFREQPHPHR
jgi:hypothetical protein